MTVERRRQAPHKGGRGPDGPELQWSGVGDCGDGLRIGMKRGEGRPKPPSLVLGGAGAGQRSRATPSRLRSNLD